MITTEKYRPPVRESEKNALLLRLERNQKDLSQLRNKLSSYRFEPRTYTLFERMENLRRSMDSLSYTNSEIIRALKGHRKTVGDYVERAKHQFSEFKRIHDSVEEYFTSCLSRGNGIQ